VPFFTAANIDCLGHVPLKNGVTSQKTPFFIVIAVKTSNLTRSPLDQCGIREAKHFDVWRRGLLFSRHKLGLVLPAPTFASVEGGSGGGHVGTVPSGRFACVPVYSGRSTALSPPPFRMSVTCFPFCYLFPGLFSAP
jgi:hypothetical protein